MLTVVVFAGIFEVYADLCSARELVVLSDSESLTLQNETKLMIAFYSSMWRLFVSAARPVGCADCSIGSM